MNTFRNKQFKNELDPKYAFYDSRRSCELKSSSEKTLEECMESCDWESSKNDLDFPKTLNVASATFASVVSQKHGGKIIEKKKEQTVDMKQLQFIASLQLVESALQVCPDNVPEKIEKQFKIETERLKKLQGL